MEDEDEFRTIKITTDRIPQDVKDLLDKTTKEILDNGKKKEEKEEK